MDIDNCIKACQQYEASAQRELYDHYVDRLYNVSMRYSKDKHEAKDVLQDALIKIFKNIGQFSGPENKFLPWMNRIVINTALAKYNKNKKTVYSDFEHSNEDMSQDPVIYDKLELEDIKASMEKLPSHLKITFKLFVVDGFKHDEIASLLKIEASSSRARVSRARSILRKILSNENFLSCPEIK